MKTRNIIIALSQAAVLAGCVQGASVGDVPNSRAQHKMGVTLNGVTLNGITLNGIALNGIVLNGSNPAHAVTALAARPLAKKN